MARLFLTQLSSLFFLWLLVRWYRRARNPPVPPESLALLDEAPAPTDEELARFVPDPYRRLGAEWIFTRGKVLTYSERRKRRWVGSVSGFDVERSFAEEYFVYRGIYGYYDHRRRLRTFRMPTTENQRDVRPGRAFIICFDRRSPRVHHLFPMVRLTGQASDSPPRDRP
jgi:hypothetical protein